jgi:hypothetical protein
MKLYVLQVSLAVLQSGLQTLLTAGLSQRRFEFVPRAQNVGFMLDVLALGQGRPKYWDRNMYYGHFTRHKFHIACPETEPVPVQ